MCDKKLKSKLIFGKTKSIYIKKNKVKKIRQKEKVFNK